MANSNLGAASARARSANSGLDQQVFVWLVVLCLGLAGWLLWDLRESEIYYGVHPFLTNSTSGAKIAPKELIDVRAILGQPSINYTHDTDAVERLYDRLHQMSLLNIYSTYYIHSDEQASKLSSSPVTNESACGQQLHWIGDKLRLYPEYQFLKGELGRDLTSFMDSFGRPGSGTFAGSRTWPGSYESCGRASLDGGRIRGRGCIAKMRFKSWPQSEAAIPRSRINIGICLPETCDTTSFASYRSGIELLAVHVLPDFYKNNLELEEIYCFPDDRSPSRQIQPAGKVFLATCVGWLILLMVATLRDARRRESGKPNGLRANATSGALDSVLQRLSLLGVWQEFKTEPLSEALARRKAAEGSLRLDMRALDFIKITMMIAIVFSHSVLIVVIQSRSIEAQVSMESSAYGRLILSIGRSVDVFFMFFGLLAAYNAPRKSPIDELVRPLAWLTTNIHILLRVWPLFFLLYCAARLVLPLMGAGPWWDYGTYAWSPRGSCMRESWLKSIPHLGMLGEPHAVTCLGPAWFIVSYVQLALVAPLITYLLYKLPNQLSRLLLLGYIFLVSSLQLFLHMHKQSTLRPEAFTLCGYFLFMLFEKFEPTGTIAPIGRLGCVAAGCYLGFLLRQYELANIRHWPGWLTSRISLAVAVVVQLAVLAMPMLGYLIAQHHHATSSIDQFVATYVIALLLWLLSTGLELICCFTIFNQSQLVAFMSWPFWRLFNKLGLAIYLIHWEVAIFGTSHNERAATHGSYEEALKLFTYTLVLTLPIAFLVHILFEAPLTRLLRPFLGQPKVHRLQTTIEFQRSGGEEAGHSEDEPLEMLKPSA